MSSLTSIALLKLLPQPGMLFVSSLPNHLKSYCESSLSYYALAEISPNFCICSPPVASGLTCPMVWIIWHMWQRFKFSVSTHESGISLTVGTCPHLFILFIQSADEFSRILCWAHSGPLDKPMSVFMQRNIKQRCSQSHPCGEQLRKRIMRGSLWLEWSGKTLSEEVIFQLRHENWEGQKQQE